MKKKTFLKSFILAIAIAMAGIGATQTASAQTNFKIGSTGYATLDDAVAAVQNGETITMQNNVTLTATAELNVNKNYTLDFGGFTLSGDYDGYLHITDGTVTLQNGSVTTNVINAIKVDGASAAVNILSGTYTGDDDAVFCYEGTVTITSGHFVSTNDTGDGCLAESGGGTINLATGSAADQTPWKNDGGATNVIITTGATPDITPPTVTGVTPTGSGAAVSGNVVITFSETMNTTTGTVQLNGSALTATGAWSSSNTVYTIPYSGLANTTYTVNISGFKDVAGNTMSVGGTHNFTTGDADFKIGSTGYATLDDAVAAVQNGETITMQNNVTLTATAELNVNKNYTLDFGGFTLSGDWDNLRITNGTVTLQNGSVTNADAYAIKVDGASAYVNILSGTYTGDDDAVCCYSGTVTITSGHFVSTNDTGDGCLVESGGGTINLATGSAADQTPWKNDGGAINVTITGATPDITPPTVTGVTPTGSGAAVSGNVVITFSETMNTTTGTVQLNGSALTATGAWSSSNTVYTIPYSGLANTTYTVNISGFKDVAGNTMSVGGTHNFTTGNADFKIGSTGYATLDDAVAAVQDGETITMLNNVTLTATAVLNVNTTYTLDFGGLTLSGNVNGGVLYITDGTVTLQNGSVTNADDYAIFVDGASAYVKILSGTYTGDDDVVLCNEGTVTITSGHFVSTNDTGDGCLVESGGGTINLATGSAADQTPWKNAASATNVIITTGATPDITPPTLSNGSYNRTSDVAATIDFDTDEAGTAYYRFLSAGTIAPNGSAVKTLGTSLGAVSSGTVSGKPVTLTAGAKDIYVVVEDAAGNISSPYQIQAAAYSGGGGGVVNAATPTITGPVGGNYTTGDVPTPLSVTASVTDGGTLTYQWYSNTTSSTSGSTAITGANSSSYTPSTAIAGTTYYYCVVTNTNTAVSGTQTATVNSTIVSVVVTSGGGGSDVTPPSFTGTPTVSRTSDVAATISFTTDEAGTAYYIVLPAGTTPAPTSAEVQAGTYSGLVSVVSSGSVSVPAGASSGVPVILAAGAMDIYVVVEDAANNVTVTPLVITATVYVPGTPSGGGTGGGGSSTGGTDTGGTTTSLTAPSIKTNVSIPAGTVGTTYNITLTASGSPTPTWSISSGDLPAGITISADGVISGTPTVAGTYTFTVKADNGIGGGATRTFTIIVVAGSVGIDEVSDIAIWASDGKLHIVCKDVQSRAFGLQIYTLGGILHKTVNVPAGETTIELPAGVYIVKVGDRVVKVVV